MDMQYSTMDSLTHLATLDDQHLLKRIALRESLALSILYDRYAANLLGFLCQLAAREQVEVLLEETFFTLWEQPQMVQEDVWNWLLCTTCRCGRARGITFKISRLKIVST